MIFYKPTKYKQSSIGQIPEEWKVKKIIDIADTFSGSTPSRRNNVYWIDKKVPWLKSGELGNSFVYETEEKISEQALQKTAVRFVDKNTLLVAMYGATAGKVGYTKIKTTINQAICAIVPRSNEFNPLFGFYFFIFNNKLLVSESSGGAQSNINQDVIKNFRIILPPLPEQQKIAEVLSKIDEAIEIAGKSIEKWQRIKKAAMRQLLTRGIGHKRFKYVEGIGEIPEEWDVKRLGDKEISKSIYYGITAKKVDYSTNLKMLRTTDIKNFNFDYSKLPHCEITDNKNSIEKYKLQTGDLIVARAGTVGVSVLVDKDYDDVVFGSYLIKAKLNKKNVLPKYLHLFFQSDLYWKHLEGAQGSTLKNINLPLLRNLLVPLPPLSEQQKIASILQKIDQVIEVKQQKKKHLERAKKEMMRLLLTGKVRIKI